MSVSDRLVIGRACGTCTKCCTELTIKAPELKKLPGETCRHCLTSKGCEIYEVRPDICRTWYCGWRTMKQLDESWRPDRLGLMLVYENNDIPDHYSHRMGLKLLVIGAPGVLKSDKVVDLIASGVSGGIPIFIGAPGSLGRAGGKSLLNEPLLPALRAGDKPRAVDIIWGAYRAAKAVKQEPINLD